MSVFAEIFQKFFHKKVFLAVVGTRQNQAQSNSAHEKKRKYCKTEFGSKIGDNLDPEKNAAKDTEEN